MAAAGYVQELRALVGTRPLIVPGIRAILRDAEGRVLLQRRGDFGTWGLPAGAIELGETVWDALVREVFEETGLTVLAARPFGVFSNPAYTTTYPNGDRVQPFTVGFLVDAWSGTPTADGDESLELRFFAPDALPPAEAMHPPHRRVLDDLRRFEETGALVVD